MNILFINSCVRGKEISRTYKIAGVFIDELKRIDNSVSVTEKNLSALMPSYMNEEKCAAREALIREKSFADPMFDLAREFAEADRIVIANPLWELSFPAILKAYIENVSVAGISFCYKDNGSIGLCRAEKMMFITTRGSDFSIPPMSSCEFGAGYLRALCAMYGIKSFECIAANGLDLEGADERNIIASVTARVAGRAAEFLK